MIVIDIFKENHRSSEKTPHPAPHSLVDAANLAEREEIKMATHVVAAGYGVWNKTMNVTSQIQDAYANHGERNFTADDRFGDPAPGQRKYLYIFWNDGTNTASGVVGENDATGINLP